MSDHSRLALILALGEGDRISEWASLRACSCGYDSVHVRGSLLACAHCGREEDGLSWPETIANWNEGIPDGPTPILILDR